MSRSTRKPYYKDKGMSKSMYNRIVRHNWNQELRINWDKEDLEFKGPKTMVNDYTFRDYTYVQRVDPFIKPYFYEYDEVKDAVAIIRLARRTTEEDVRRYSRK